jgi:hypothetical protein
MAEQVMLEFLEEFLKPGLKEELPDETKTELSDLLDVYSTKEALAERMKELVPPTELEDASCDEVVEAVSELVTPEEEELPPLEDGDQLSEDLPLTEKLLPTEGQPLTEGLLPTEEVRPTEEVLVTKEEAVPSDEEVLAALVPALATDANQTIEATKTALFADITQQLWDAVKSALTEELKGKELTGTKEEIQTALYTSAWEALNAAADGLWEAGSEADSAGLSGWASLLSQS